MDYRDRIGDKLCTGVIGIECATRFPVPSQYVYRKVASAIIHSPGGHRYRVARPEPQALIMDRVAYVSSVADSAAAEGAQYFKGYRVTAIDRTPNAVRVSAQRGPTSGQFECRLLMLAAGFRSPLIDMAGLGDRRQQEYLVGQQTVVETNGVTEVQVYTGHDAVPDSIGWLVPTTEDQALVGTISRRPGSDLLTNLVDGLNGRGVVRSGGYGSRRWGIPLRPLSRTSGNRTLVLGDAAGFTKPTSGGGIYYAMLSGVIAAGTASNLLDSGDLSDRALNQYDRRWKREFGQELQVGYCARKLFESLSDSQKEDLMRVCLSEEVQSELMDAPDFSFDRHSYTILKTIGHRPIARMLFEFGSAAAPLLTHMVRSATLR